MSTNNFSDESLQSNLLIYICLLSIKGYQREMERIALEAGKVIKETITKTNKRVFIKNDDTTDLVTETDRWVENYVRAELSKLEPDWEFIGEESCTTSDPVIPEGPCWIIDPIDGTTNFVHGFPEVGVSIALVIGREPVIGVILNPVSGQLLSAIKGQGTKLNGNPWSLDTSPKSLNQCFVMTQFMNAGNRSERMKQIDDLLDVPVHACRFIGCATMAICYVATGVTDVYFERGLKAWDMAAGIVIIKEAGGVVWDYSGTGQCDLARREIIAARNIGIAQDILDLIKKN